MVDLWDTDKVHLQQLGSRCRMSIPPFKTDPILRHYPTRKGVGCFGAVRLRYGNNVYRREAGSLNFQTSYAFLRKLRHEAVSTSRRVVMIMDHAKYHHARLHKGWRERIAGRPALDLLSSYSPVSNPIERVSKLTRRLCLHIQCFPTFDAVTEAVEEQFSQSRLGNNTLRAPYSYLRNLEASFLVSSVWT